MGSGETFLHVYRSFLSIFLNVFFCIKKKYNSAAAAAAVTEISGDSGFWETIKLRNLKLGFFVYVKN